MNTNKGRRAMTGRQEEKKEEKKTSQEEVEIGELFTAVLGLECTFEKKSRGSSSSAGEDLLLRFPKEEFSPEIMTKLHKLANTGLFEWDGTVKDDRDTARVIITDLNMQGLKFLKDEVASKYRPHRP